MSIKERLQEEIKNAMKNKDQARLAVLRMAKGALLLKEKESAKDQALTDEEAVSAIRGEIRKRQQSIDIFRQHGRE
ncbi:MAG: GatB/YqeY protein, partial [Candidatus Hydrogenedentes bacterium]|nr:GatB/YqeY protein [Candidatus Hydrogenedentota bacterium]